jgi:hypothetical protein
LIRGGVAQLGEHLLCKQGVRGSTPLISTRETKARGGREGRYPDNRKYGLIAQVVRARA